MLSPVSAGNIFYPEGSPVTEGVAVLDLLTERNVIFQMNFTPKTRMFDTEIYLYDL